MSKTEAQSDALRLAALLEQGRWLPVGNGSPIDESAAELRRLDAENKALRELLDASPKAAPTDAQVFTTPSPELNDLLRETSFLASEGANMDGAMMWLESLERVLALLAAPTVDALRGVRRYHFVQRSKFGPWTEVERQTDGSVAFVKEGDLSPQAAAKTGDAA